MPAQWALNLARFLLEAAMVESTQLSALYHGVTKWPQTTMELNALVDHMERVLPAPFVAAYLFSEEEQGMRLGFRSDLPALPAIVESFLKNAMRDGTISESGFFREIQVSGAFLAGHYLGSVPIVIQKGHAPQSMGWVFAALPRAFGSKDEVLLISIGQRLAELAEIAYLESEIQLRSQFLSIASHELKTPLTSVYGMLQLMERTMRLKRDDPLLRDPEKQVSYIHRMIRQVERLNELIDGLLDVSRIQNGRFMVEPSETDVVAIVRDVVSTRLETIAREAGVTLQLDLPDKMLAWVDPVRMEELVTNLGMNGIRFSPEGGVVWIKLRQDGDQFRLSVRDQGPSVPATDRERIFKPFERAQRTARLGGLGLGLFISRQIAQLHGGNVSMIESVPGKGNVLEAYFPIRRTGLASA